MAHIKPFNAYLFSPDKVGDLGSVMAPSYTVKDEAERDELYNKNPYNAVRLVSGKKTDEDTEKNNEFTRASEYLKDWIDSGVIVKDEKPSIYLYEQAVIFNGTIFTNRGFVSLVRLDDFKKQVVFCESTTPVKKKHHYELLSHTKANFNMISCLYIESEKFLSDIITELCDTEPDVSFGYSDGTKERLWRISDKERIDFIVNAMAYHTLYITDGQNRFETSLKYQKACMKNNPNHTGEEPYNYIMTLLTNAYDDGIVQLPYHRLVRAEKPINESFLVSALQDNFKVEKIIVDKDTSDLVETIKHQISLSKSQNSLALYMGGDYFYRMTLINQKAMKDAVKNKSEAYRSLDISVLNYLILKDILGLSPEDNDEHISITKSVSAGIKKVKSKEYQCLFAINPVKDSQIRSVAMSGDKMPEKSICVFPKPVTGVVINLL